MPPRPTSGLAAFAALTLEGNLIAPAMLARIATGDADAQAEADYAIPPGLRLRDEIARYFRIGQAHHDRFAKLAAPTPAATTRFAQDLLARAFGFTDVAPADAPVALTAGGRVPVVVVPPSDSLDRPSPSLATDRRRSAAGALQDRLNADDATLWGLATNGSTLRLMRDNASLTRPAWLEADLAQIFAAEDFASFTALWLLVHRTRFGQSGPPADCPLERWREAGARAGEAARNRLRDGVEAALRALGTGFLEANPDLRARLADGSLDLTQWFNELLRLVYRLIFLMVAEDRDLLHTPDAGLDARRLYAEGYSLARLRERARRRTAWDHHADRWQGVRILFRALAGGEPRLGLPALGGLFARGETPSLDDARLGNRALMEAIYRLAWLEGDAIVPVNWRDMQTEELGSVYESLLELTPRLTPDPTGAATAFAFAGDAAETRGNQRKTTGSYYTPDSLVQALLDSALDPVLDRVEAEADDPAAALAAVTVIDPACGSGHFLLAAARRIAGRVARHRADGTPSAADYRHALRDVVRASIFGVDRNPMAVELTKVALWIETVEPGKPLGFLDANIRCGDALLGVFDRQVLYDGIPDAAYKPLTGDDKDTAKYYARANRDYCAGQRTIGYGGDITKLPTARPFSRAFTDLRAMPEDDLEEIAAKAAQHRTLREARDFHFAELACNLYVAAFLLPKTGGPPPSRGARRIPTTEDLWQTLRGESPYGPLHGAATIAMAARAFHWPLEFPAIMAKGGFDVVLGNPPWEVMQLSEKEYFAARIPEIAELTGAARKKAIADLETTNPAAFAAYAVDKRAFDAGNEFARASGRFDRTASGKINTYSLFADLFSALVSPQGRAGVIVPTGIATDATTAPFFGSLIENRRLASLIDFENRDAIFPGVHRSYKFSLLTLGSGIETAAFAFFLTDPNQLAEPERNFTLTPEAIAAINPNTKTAPVFRSRADAELTAKIYARVPVLIDETRGKAGNPWGVEFRQGLFNMTSDSGLFRTAAQLADAGYVRDGTDWLAEGARPRQSALALAGGRDTLHLDLQGGAPRAPTRYVPLYEAKMISFFDHRAAGYGTRGDDRGYRVLPETTLLEHKDPAFEPEPYYWVAAEDVKERLGSRSRRGYLLGWKDVTAATNERTGIFSAIPVVGVGHTLPLMFSDASSAEICGAYAALNSLACDYVARQKVAGLHVTYGYLKQFPIPSIDVFRRGLLDQVTWRVFELTYTSHAMAPFARDLGHDGPPFAWDEDRRAHLRAELDAFYARAYGLTRDELRYILDPADVKGADYPSETFRVLKANEIRRHGDYRTARLVLAAWDRFDTDGTFAALGM